MLIGGHLTAWSTESLSGIGGGIHISETQLYNVSSTSFSRPAARAPRRVSSQANGGTAVIQQKKALIKTVSVWGRRP